MDQHDNHSRQIKLVDMRIPLPWLLTSGCVVLLFLASTLWNVSSQSNKLDQVVISTAKIELNVSAQDAKLDKVKESMYTMQRQIDNQQLRIESLERGSRK